MNEIDLDEAEAHRRRMQEMQAQQRQRVAANTGRKGLLMVHTGDGKGKSTAAFGMALRTLGHGKRVGIVQFVKGSWRTGEQRALQRFSDLMELHVMGEGFTWDTQDRARDIAAARSGWAVACRMLQDPELHLVVLDELNIVLRYDYLPLAEVMEGLTGRRDGLHVVVTGRNAQPDLLAAADLVSEMVAHKHPFDAGIKAQQGVEF